MSKRKILTTIILPAILISVLIIVIVNNRQEKSGELVLSVKQLDFGTIPEWEGEVTREITVKNIGKKMIKIHKIQTGYAYIAIEGPSLIQPGSEETFKVHITPSNLPSGKTTTTSIFFTDSPLTPQVYLTINALVDRFATLSAEVCDFGEIGQDAEYEKKIRLCVNAPIKQDEIRLMPSHNPMLTWEMEPDVNPKCYIININLKISNEKDENDIYLNRHSQSTPFTALLTVAFPNDRTLTLPITARVIPPVYAKPESLSYGVITENIAPSLEFTLSSKNAFTILNIEAPAYLQIVETSNSLESEEPLTPYKHWFKVTLDVSKSPALLREKIVIDTTATEDSIRIPIYGYIKTVLLSDTFPKVQSE